MFSLRELKAPGFSTYAQAQEPSDLKRSRAARRTQLLSISRGRCAG